MIRKSLVTLAAATAIVATASPASARPVPDSPIYCGPGYTLHGATCTPVHRLDLHHDTLGEWVLGGLGVIALLALA